MCAACVAQGAAYLVPAYAVVKTTTRRRRRRRSDPVSEAATPNQDESRAGSAPR